MNFFEEMQMSRYGAMELKRFVGPNLMRGLLISLIAHTVIISWPYVLELFQSDEEIVSDNVVVIDVTQLTKLKSLQNAPQQVQIAVPKLAAPKAAMPVAVKEDEVEMDQQMMLSQRELSQIIAAPTAGDGTIDLKPGEDFIINDDAGANSGDNLSPDKFVPFEVAPQPLTDCPLPQYPDVAKTVGVKGFVKVKVLVDKDGTVKKFLIMEARPKDLGFEEEVQKVIMKWKFTPAIQNQKPVAVWAEIPFNFSLEQ